MAKKYNELEYTYAVARIKALGNKALTGLGLEKMIAAKNLTDAARALTELGWQEVAGNGEIDFEGMLAAEEQRNFDIIEELSGGQVLKILRNGFDYHNLKALIKAEFQGGEPREELLSHNGNVPLEVLRKSLLERSYLGMSEFMKEAVEDCLDQYPRLLDPQLIDINLDAAMFKDMARFAAQQPDKEVRRLAAVQIDLHNIKSFMRICNMGKGYALLSKVIVEGGLLAKAHYLENSANGDKVAEVFAPTLYAKVVAQGLADNLERALDMYLFATLDAARHMSFGLAPIYAYALQKQAELQNVRIVMTCKKNGIAADVIRSRVRV